MFTEIATGNIYSLDGLRQLFPRTGIPNDISDRTLEELGFLRYIPATIEVTLEQYKEIKAKQIRDIAALEMRTIVNNYSSEERETWHIQVVEAKAYNLNPLSSTPLLDALVVQRGNTKQDQVNRILSNLDIFESEIGTILGKQQNRLDLIYSAVSKVEVDSIIW